MLRHDINGISRNITKNSICYRKADNLIHRFTSTYEIAFSLIDVPMSVSYDISWHTSVIYEISNLVQWHGRYWINNSISRYILVYLGIY